MRIVLATDAFDHVAGSETYLLTAAEHLQRLGHAVTIHAARPGAMAELAQARGIPVAGPDAELPPCDVALIQDAGMAYALAERLPAVPQVLVAHSDVHDFQLPPMLPGVTRAVVVLNERVGRRVAAIDPPYPVVRLRQPVDAERLAALGPPRERPRVAVLLGNEHRDERRRLLEKAWSPHGVEIRVVGLRGRPALEPWEELADADIVVGKGRAILDGMACGRPAYVYDDFGTDGWVTAGAYASMEADGFAGQALARTTDRELLERDLRDYDPVLGLAGRELVLAHHGARNHARELVGVLRTLAPDAPPAATADGELARNVRLRWAADRELGALRSVQADLVGRVRAAEEQAREAARHAEAAGDHAARQTARAEAAEALLEQRRVQLGLAAGRVLDRVRRTVGR